VLPRRECPRCAAAQSLEARECTACGAPLPLPGLPVDQELQLLRRWLSFIALGSLVVGVVVWQHRGTTTGQVPGVAPEVLAAPYVVAATVLSLLWLVAPRFPLLVGVATLLLFWATWGATYLIDPHSGIGVGPSLWLRLIFLFVIVQAVIAGYHARKRQRETARSSRSSSPPSSSPPATG
jgi:hypothetical protein